MPDQRMPLRYRVFLPAQFILQHFALLATYPSQFPVDLVSVGGPRVTVALVDYLLVVRFALFVRHEVENRS